MKNKISLSEPFFNKDDYTLVKRCIQRGWVSTSGEYIEKFEKKISKYTGSKYAIATINGTTALQISIKLAGVMPNDEVIVPTLTFIAPVNAIKYNLANPLFMDVDNFCNLDENKTIDFIVNKTVFKNGSTFNKKSKKRISALIVVHVWGNAASFFKLKSICEKRNIKIIEDASESLGTFYINKNFKGKHTGTLGTIGCLSFNGNKIITSGGGGMILTNNKSISQLARYYINQAKDNSINFIHNDIGYNFKLTNINAALGITQLKKISTFLNKKKIIRSIYQKGISGIKGLSLIPTPTYSQNNFWLNILYIDQKKYNKKKDVLIKEFRKNKIEVRPIWQLNHLQKPYIKYQTYKIYNANKLIKNCICLPSSVFLNNKDQKRILKIMEQ